MKYSNIPLDTPDQIEDFKCEHEWDLPILPDVVVVAKEGQAIKGLLYMYAQAEGCEWESINGSGHELDSFRARKALEESLILHS